MSFLAIWGSGFLLIMVFLTVLWLFSVKIKNASIVDPFWGLGFIILVFYYQAQTKAFTLAEWILVVLVTVWGLRLSLYLLFRNTGKGEDFRYQEFRRKYGPERYWWFSFFQVFLLQGALMTIISLPLLGALYNPQNAQLTIGFYIGGLIVWLIGFVFETIGDYQLSQFKQSQKTGELLTSGLWRYTRHPNYFGDAMVWWAYGLFSVANGTYWTLLGSLVMMLLLLRVSGVSLLEKTLKETKEGYQEYIDSTPAFFPWLPKRTNG